MGANMRIHSLKRWSVCAAVAVLAVGVVAVVDPAFAQDAAHAVGDAATGHGGEHHSGGLPQLNPASYASQIFWTFVTFGLLLWLMSKVALPRVGEVLEARQEKIANDLDKAGALKAEAEAVMQAYEKAITEARANAHKVIADSVAAADAEGARRNSELAADLAQRARAAEERIQAAQQAALGNVRTVSTEAAQAAVERLVGVSLGADMVGTTVDAVLKERA